MPTSVIQTYTQSSLTPYKWEERVLKDDYSVAANQVIPQGGIVAMLTGAAADDVQTVSNTATGGTFTVTVGNALTATTTALTCTTCTAAQLQAALNAAFATLCPAVGTTGFVTVTTTTPFSSGAGALVVTFNNGTGHAGPLSNNPQSLMTVNNSLATGGTVTVAHTTTGINAGAIVNYNSAVLPTPTTATTLTATGTAGTIGAGTYEVTYTFANSLGVETAAANGAFVTLTSAQSIQITSISGLAAGVAKVNFYIDGLRAASVTPSSSATGTVTISAAPSASAPSPPSAEFATNNPAYSNTDGSQIPIGAAWYGMAAAPNGVVTYGSTQPTGNEYKPNWYTGNIAIAGAFDCANLVTVGAAGVDQNTVNTLGRLIAPGLTTGVLLITGV